MNAGSGTAFSPRMVFASLLVVALTGTTGLGQEWAEKMFDHTSYDFGTVAAGTKVEHRFRFENIYVEDVQLLSVRGECPYCSAHPTWTAPLRGVTACVRPCVFVV